MACSCGNTCSDCNPLGRGGKADMSSIKSEEVKGKVNNKLNKLKALRKRNGSK
jgi:hypothetical protein